MQVKQCSKCGVEKPLTEFPRDRRRLDGRAARCRTCKSEHDKLAANAGYETERKRRYRASNREVVRGRENEYFRGWADRLKAEVFGHYGRSCACCGATERMTIDHVHGDGAEHRAELFGAISKSSQRIRMYRWLIKNGFPEGFQTLCLPCNTSKGKRERCALDHGGAR